MHVEVWEIGEGKTHDYDQPSLCSLNSFMDVRIVFGVCLYRTGDSLYILLIVTIQAFFLQSDIE